MRFMVIVKASKDSEAGKMPSEEMLGAMAKFNEEMVKAGVMADGAGLQASSKGAGYWIINVKSKDEAIEWMMRCPNPHEEDGDIEIRQMFEMEDFGDSPAVEHHKANEA